MKDLNEIQKIIDAKAKARATKDIEVLIKAAKIFRSGALQTIAIDTRVIVQIGEEKEVTSLRELFWSIGSRVPEYLIEELTKLYIPEESREFVKEVERLKEQVDDLYSIKEDK